MDLKRNDKIILIVGVVILIVAGAGIALYNTPSDSNNINNDNNEGDYYFEYNWEEKTGSLGTISPRVEKGTDFEDTYNIKIPDGAVLTQIKVNIKWEDDKTFGIFRTRGQDVLSETVTFKGSPNDKESTLKGNDNFTFKVNTVPKDGNMYASSTDEFQSELEKEFGNMDTAEIDVMLSIMPGEPGWRLLFRKDTGNEVDITIDYTYYNYDYSYDMEDGDDMKSSGSNGDDGVNVGNHYLGEFYVNLGYGRGMI
jgi:hypothetical protein